MDESIVFKVALIGVLGIGSQWLAWRLQLPAIVLMAVAGVMAGPVLGILSPVEDFGDLLRPMVAVAVAIILFEGAEMLLVVRPSGEIAFNTEGGRPKAKAEDVIVGFAPGDADRKAAERSKPSIPG